MNVQEAITLIQISKGAKLYGVKFMAEGYIKPDGKTYTYKDLTGEPRAFGDLVIVEARDSYAIAQVVELSVEPTAVADLGRIRHIVMGIDLVAHKERLAAARTAAQAFVMAEVNDRINQLRNNVGATNFDNVAKLLGRPEVVNDEGELEHQGDARASVTGGGAIMVTETGEIVGYIQDAHRYYGLAGFIRYSADGKTTFHSGGQVFAMQVKPKA